MTVSRDRDGWLTDGAACLEAALVYLSRGWSVIPLCPPDHVGVGKEHLRKCTDSRGKAPLVPWAELQKRRATEAEVREWWRAWPNANVGIVMGAVSGMVGFDIDGPAGDEAWSRLLAVGDVPPPSLEFLTPGGGRRLLYAVADVSVRLTFEAFSEGELRIMGEGSQTVAPPSRHASGGYYQWVTAPPR
jgi:hypothetical protein